MIIGTPDTIPGEYVTKYHGGKGSLFRRTLLNNVPNSVFKYVRDIVVPTGATIAEHTHTGDEEIYFVISGNGIMVVDGEECVLGPGSATLTLSGSTHGIRNEAPEELRILVTCAKVLP
jgi:mannose-6-phosphate isomerase-like protein (cupin superfamily)